MEANRSAGGRTKRKPLADCTNIISRPSQQPLKNVFNRILDHVCLKEKPKDSNTSVAATSGTASRSLTASQPISTNVRPVTRRRVSTDLGSPASTSSRPQISSSDLGAGDKEFRRIVDQTTPKEKPKDVNTSVAAVSGNASRSVSRIARPITRSRVSTDLGSPTSAPSRPQTSSSDLGVSDREFKRIVDQTALKEKTKDVNTSVAPASGSASRSVSTNVRTVTRRRVSTDLGSPASAPSRPQTSSSNLGISDKEFRRTVDQTTLKEKPKDVNTSVAAVSGSASRSLTVSRSVSTNVRPVTRSRMSTNLGSPASAPSRPQTSSSDFGVSDNEISEPWSVYTVRRKRNKDTSFSRRAARLVLDLTSSPGKSTQQADINKTKPSKEPPKKRQRTVKQEKQNSVLGAPQDDIEKQKAFFAELDASELPVEEVSSSDSD